MKESMAEIERHFNRLKSELRNFEEIASQVKPDPGDIPKLPGIDIAGESIPLNGKVGGDHIIYLDFNQRYDLDARIREAERAGLPDVVRMLERNRTRAGVLVADAAGHKLTDAALAAMLHQAFLLGVLYELDMYGTVTTRLFENLNTRFYYSSSLRKYLTMVYGEISQDGMFRFINAAHPFPIVFSHAYDQMVTVARDMPRTFPPIGTMPSKDDVDRKLVNSPLGQKSNYVINDINLMGEGDILLLFTDGFWDHGEHTMGPFGEQRLESVLREVKDMSAEGIVAALKAELMGYAEATDDISLVVIKRKRQLNI